MRFIGLMFALGLSVNTFAQKDTLVIDQYGTFDDIEIDTLSQIDSLADSLKKVSDSILYTHVSVDSSNYRHSSIDGIINYQAEDSIRFDLRTKKVYLYKKDEVEYGPINLQGDYMEIDFNKSEIFARGVEDSIGKVQGNPIFKESEEEFASEEIRFNFDTKKGLISGVKTEESGGYLHGEKVKMMPDKTVYIKGGRFTTCELDHPHYAFRFRKSKVIPGDKIITGPAFFEVANVPTPIMVPFGLFPNQQGKQSGIIVPQFGQENKKGYYLGEGGYYWAVNDHLDLTFKGSIYSRGSWSIQGIANYKARYKYSGKMDLRFANNIIGSEGSADYTESKDFAIIWNHRQDPKARPKSNFSASVNIRSNSYNEYEVQNSINDRVSNSYSSSINYSTRFGDNWNLNANLGHSQSTINKTIDLKLPQISLSGTRFFPFRKKDKVGNLSWYENISMQYSMQAVNQVSIADSLLFTPGWEQYFKNGMKHTIPISSSVKILKHLNWTNTINLTSRWYSQSYTQHWVDETHIGFDTIAAHVATDTTHGFVTANDYKVSSTFTTKIYGMFLFGNNFPVNAIRHVVTPSVSFSYRPDFSEEKYGYFDTYYNPEKDEYVQYSIFQGSVYSSPASGKQGSLNFSLSNNFEMKVRDRNDTITGTKKVVLIDNLALSTSYNMARDSLRWSPLLVTARTKLFKNLDIKYASAWDPYVLDSTGTKNLDQFEWAVNGRLFRLKDMGWTFGLNLKLSNDMFDKKSNKDAKKDKKAKKEKAKAGTVPWSVNLRYSLSYKMNYNYINYMLTKDDRVIQTLSASANVQLTPNWLIRIQSGYDFTLKKLTPTQVEIMRDLHCWEMRFFWIPFGNYQSWNFAINIKSPMFKDLKLEKKKSHLDY